MDFKRDILPLKNIIFRTALRITMNREESEDIVQDTLLKMWERRDELQSVSNLEAFAVTSARNLALDRMGRASQKEVSLDENIHDRQDEYQVSAQNNLEKQENLSFINNLIQQLPEKQRTILQLRDIEGKAYKEIAEMLSITEADVKVNLFRARNFLKNNCKSL